MDASHLELHASLTADHFSKEFGRLPRWLVAAPGRVNLIGEHVDYNDGLVLPMAIDRYCVVAARDAPGEMAELFSVAMADRVKIPLAQPPRHAEPNHWSNYVAGVIAGFARRGIRPTGFQAVIHSLVPVGGGLSSSAALEVATATLLEAITGAALDPIEKALLCQRAEHEYAGVPCGIMDQFASVLCREDHLMLLDCRSQQVKHIPLLDPRFTVLIIDTNVKHQLAGGEYAERRAQCESAARKLGVTSLRDVSMSELEQQRGQLDPIEYRRARHVIGEIERTAAAAAAVRARDWTTLGRLMYASHESLQGDYAVSCDELDLLVELAHRLDTPGAVVGSRMTGGGFGGCTVSLVETDRVGDVADQLCDSYRAATGIEPDYLISRPAGGAHVVRSR